MLTFISNSGKFFILSLKGTLYIHEYPSSKRGGMFHLLLKIPPSHSQEVGQETLALLTFT
jgi:hypothetical protein